MSQSSAWQTSITEQDSLQALGKFELTSDAEDKLLAYCRALQEYNEHTNLVSNANLSALLKEHVIDSLQLLPWIRDRHGDHSLNLIDIGSGAGFPGMVLAIAVPSLAVTLVDSIGKKCKFLEGSVNALGLDDRVRIICNRAEILGHDRELRETFDFATARAIGALPMVAELCLPFLKIGGLLLAQRSKRQAVEEVGAVDSYAYKLGAKLAESAHFEKDLLNRELSLLVFEKMKSTPKIFPRSAAQLKKGSK